MNRKIIGLILGIAAVLIVAAVSMGAISADNPNEVTVGNETFHIPDGFREVNSSEINGTLIKFFKNDSGAEISISVTKLPGRISNISLNNGDVRRTIAGIDGVYCEENHTFKFSHENNLIFVMAPDENMFEGIISNSTGNATANATNSTDNATTNATNSTNNATNATTNATEVTIVDETFHIPDGFRETNSSENNGTLTKDFENDTGAIIVINVFKAPGRVSNLPLTDGEVNKTIAGIEGNYNEQLHMFKYSHENNVIVIIAPDESLIESMIK